MKAAFDGYKMVSFAINVEPSPPAPPPPPSPSADVIGPAYADADLWRDALWYPDVPPPSLCLNQDAFFPARAYFVSHYGYNPLIWCHFGGPGGKYLPYLTRTVVTSGRDDTYRIAFVFGGGENVPVECRSLGRLGRLSATGRRVVEFPVDGAGGERIEAVEIGHWFCQDGEGQRWDVEHGLMGWFKLHTNRGRSCLISNSDPDFKGVTSTRTVSAVPGTAITGFYATQYPDEGYGMAALGVITEAVEPTNDDDSESE